MDQGSDDSCGDNISKDRKLTTIKNDRLLVAKLCYISDNYWLNKSPKFSTCLGLREAFKGWQPYKPVSKFSYNIDSKKTLKDLKQVELKRRECTPLPFIWRVGGNTKRQSRRVKNYNQSNQGASVRNSDVLPKFTVKVNKSHSLRESPAAKSLKNEKTKQKIALPYGKEKATLERKPFVREGESVSSCKIKTDGWVKLMNKLPNLTQKPKNDEQSLNTPPPRCRRKSALLHPEKVVLDFKNPHQNFSKNYVHHTLPQISQQRPKRNSKKSTRSINTLPPLKKGNNTSCKSKGDGNEMMPKVLLAKNFNIPYVFSECFDFKVAKKNSDPFGVNSSGKTTGYNKSNLAFVES